VQDKPRFLALMGTADCLITLIGKACITRSFGKSDEQQA
jgi:hypothetical protein